jgi:hypothetical protein
MSENIALNGHTLKNYKYKMHEKNASKTVTAYFFVRQAFTPFLIVDEC